jgi:superfamily II DNA or RNA helicase
MKRKFDQAFIEAKTNSEQIQQWLYQSKKRLFILKEQSILPTPDIEINNEEQFEPSLEFSSQESHSSSITTHVESLEFPEEEIHSPIPTYSSTIDLKQIAHLSNEFPIRKRGDMFAASDFQKALVNHIEHYRVQYEQKLGLVVISTGLGKTILAILLLQEQIERHQLELTLRIFPEKPAIVMKANDQQPKKPRLIIMNAKRKREEMLKKKPLFCFLFLVHSKLIRDGSFAKFKEHFIVFGFPESSFINVDQSESISKASLENKQFIFCLFQSFDKIPEEFIRNNITHVCIDEVHHLVATTYNQVFTTLTSSLHNEGDLGIRFILGMTATLHHRDDPQGTKLKTMFKDTVYIDFPWTVAKKLNYFPPVSYVECVTTNTQVDLETYESIRVQLEEKKITVLQFVTKLERSIKSIGMHTDEQATKRTTAEYVCTTFHSFCKAMKMAKQPSKKKIIIFTASCAVADRLEVLLIEKGYSARAIHYNTKKAKAKEALERFHNGKLRIVINVMMMNEGFDVKGVDCVVMARTTESELVFVQQMGRALRKNNEDKNQNVTILDICFNLRRRWKRLLQETDNKHLQEFILSFWHVDSFVGLPEPIASQ